MVIIMVMAMAMEKIRTTTIQKKDIKIEKSDWDLVIEPQSKWFDLKLRSLFKYRDLMILFVRRDIVTVYKQTILGPTWFFIQPILTTLIFTIIFGRVAKISTDGLPHILFYLSGIIVWNIFCCAINFRCGSYQNSFNAVFFTSL